MTRYPACVNLVAAPVAVVRAIPPVASGGEAKPHFSLAVAQQRGRVLPVEFELAQAGAWRDRPAPETSREIASPTCRSGSIGHADVVELVRLR